MQPQIVIVGGLDDNPDRRTFLDELVQVSDGVSWDWLQADAACSWTIPDKILRPFVGRLRSSRDSNETRLVKLHRLHNRQQNQLYKLGIEIVHCPKWVTTTTELSAWLLSEEAGLVSNRPWVAGNSEAALWALFAKLVKNKSWNKNSEGHAWTMESDLLGQSPVNRPENGEIKRIAGQLLQQGNGTLFLSKGGSQGKTPKEWSIKTAHLPAVMRALSKRDISEVINAASFKSLHSSINRGEGSTTIEGDIVSERVLSICRENLSKQK